MRGKLVLQSSSFSNDCICGLVPLMDSLFYNRYGAILEQLQGRPDILDKIKGCIFDSGGDPNIDPKVSDFVLVLFLCLI